MTERRGSVFDNVPGFVMLCFLGACIAAWVAGSWAPVVVVLLWIIGVMQLFDLISR